MPAIWDIMRISYVGTVWDHSGHYDTVRWDITTPPPLLESWKDSPSLLISKSYLGVTQQSCRPLNSGCGFDTIEASELIIVRYLKNRKQHIPFPK